MTPNGCLFKHCLKKPYYIGGGGGVAYYKGFMRIWNIHMPGHIKWEVQYTLTIVHVHVLPVLIVFKSRY